MLPAQVPKIRMSLICVCFCQEKYNQLVAHIKLLYRSLEPYPGDRIYFLGKNNTHKLHTRNS